MSSDLDFAAHFCRYLHEVTGLPLALAQEGGQYLAVWPEISPEFVFPRVVKLLLQDFALQKRDEDHPLILYNEPGFFTGVLRLPDGRYCLAGPVSPLSHSREEVLAYCAEAVRPYYLKAYCSMLMNAPLVSLTRMKSLLCLLAQGAAGRTIPPENLLFCDNTFWRPVSGPALDKQLFESREELRSHVPYEFETAICSAVEQGDDQELARRMTMPAQGRNGEMSGSPLRQMQYTFVAFLTLVTRAAVRGGLLAETAYSLSDIYCQSMDTMTDIDQITRLLYTAALDFCQRVKAARKDEGRSQLVRRCLEYIAVHLHEPLSLENLAGHCRVSVRTLSARFGQEMGQSPGEYIQKERIREACYLLAHTQYSLSDIAFFLNYSSQSYFARVFKEHLGCTPQQYRRRMENAAQSGR